MFLFKAYGGEKMKGNKEENKQQKAKAAGRVKDNCVKQKLSY